MKLTQKLIIISLSLTFFILLACSSVGKKIANPYVYGFDSGNEDVENHSKQTASLYNKIANANAATVQGNVTAQLTSPPNVPASLEGRPAAKVKVELEIIEKEGVLADGVTYLYWTFGGTVPGSFIRIKEGDEVDFHLQNHPDNKLAHSIDLHAVNGPGGGAEATFIAPGREKAFTFKALNPGLYVYHCAAAPIGLHIANGMYGLILVEPKEGLPPVDKEFYVMQGEFYTEGAFGESGLQAFDLDKALSENPDYVVLNGKVGGLTGDNAIKAKVGDVVRLYVGNGGPNKISSFHVIGELFDKVYIEGGTAVNENIQTTLIPVAGAAMVEFVVEAPGNYVLLDHSIFRATNKGALGILTVEGEENEKIFSGNNVDKAYSVLDASERGFKGMMPKNNSSKNDPSTKTYNPDSKIEREMNSPSQEQTPLEKQLAKGKKVFNSICFSCHQSDAKGIPGTFPPLANSDYLVADIDRAIGIVANGKKGKITVNGQQYNGVMPNFGLTDQEVADALTFVLHNFNDNKTVITPERVKKVRNN